MLIEKLKCKIHRATITAADLNYEGSITIDQTLLTEAGIEEYEKVQVVNINNGARFETYTIVGKANSGTVCLNGACARLAQKGDKVIIMAYCLQEAAAKSYKPRKIFVDDDNKII